MATITVKKLFEGKITATAGGASAQTLFTNPASTKTIITSIIVANNNAAAQAITLSKVPNSGGSVGTEAQANRFVPGKSIPANDVWQPDPPPRVILEDTNDTIQAFAGVANDVNVFLYGIQET